ncbi:hypothetical protein AB0J52_27825, partial [Spirillospora sp. NPDC049652]
MTRTSVAGRASLARRASLAWQSSVVWRAFVLQALLSRRSPSHALILLVAPMQTTSLLALTLHAHRPDAVASAVIAPSL